MHRDVINRHLEILNTLKIPRPAVILSSYGLANLYNYMDTSVQGTVMLVDVDLGQVDIAILSSGKMVFSRYFKFNFTLPNWTEIFSSEINKTQDAYLKEFPQEPLTKVILPENRHAQELLAALSRQTRLPAEILNYTQKTNIPQLILSRIKDTDNSLFNLIGLGFKETEESLNLLPQEVKEKVKIGLEQKELIRNIALGFGIFILLSLATARNLDNRQNKLKAIKLELAKIENDAKALAEIEKRFELLRSHSQKKPSSLDVLYEINRLIPAEVSLISFSYEEDNQVILHGVAPERSFVFKLVSELEKSAVFQSFNPKVRYATNKTTPGGEIVDFEISCLKEK